MLYLFVDKNQIKLVYLKKNFMNQYESAFYEKVHQVDLMQNGQASTDLLASAIKEALTVTFANNLKEKDVNLILPQEAFQFLRAEVPPDITPSAVSSFIREKARSQLSIEVDNCYSDYILQINDKHSEVLFFAIDKELFKKYSDAFALLNLNVAMVIPETLAYFKLLEKTLRKDKQENILFASVEKNQIKGYLFDSYGPIEGQKFHDEITEGKTIESILKQKATDYETQGKKLNRLILSGEDSENIRQDTFTKNVGVWTNPLKRIIQHFYQDYLKLFVIANNKPLPILLYDVCLGAFIFSLENKNFSLLKKRVGSFQDVSSASQKIRTPRKFPFKDIGIFLVSFIVSFLILTLLSKYNVTNLAFVKLPNVSFTKPTAVPTKPAASPTPTKPPAPALKRADVKIKVLNGSGIVGKANDVKDILTKLGYDQVLTGNADSYDYTISEIQVKKENKDALTKLIQTDLKDHVASPKFSALAPDSASDILIIVGTDFE